MYAPPGISDLSSGAGLRCLQVLEALDPETPMLPPEGSAERARAAELMRLERKLFSAWLQWLCNGW